MARAREDHSTGAAFDGGLPRYLRGVLAVIELLRHWSLIPVRIDVDDVVHAHLSVFGSPDGFCLVRSPYLLQPATFDVADRTTAGASCLRGKSGHHRARWSVTPTRGNPR